MLRPMSLGIIAMAQAAYEEIQSEAPADVPRWRDLHPVERDHLVRFAAAVRRAALAAPSATEDEPEEALAACARAIREGRYGNDG